MTDSTGNSPFGDDIIKVSNVFDQEMIDFLIKDCDKQLKYNLIDNGDVSISMTKPILDCHGLRICDDNSYREDPEFPYSVDKWNKFSLHMQNIMFRYCDRFNIDMGLVTPHSCWLEHSTSFVNPTNLLHLISTPVKDIDVWLNKRCGVEELTHFRIVYFLKSDCEEKGMTLTIGDKIKYFKGVENSLYIIPTNNYNFKSLYTCPRYTLMFNWYLHPRESEKEPTWKFPNKFNNEKYLQYVKDRINLKFLTKKS